MIKKALVVFLGSILFAVPAMALTVLKSDEARAHIGDAKQHFLSSPYTVEILTRSHRDAMHGRFSDAVLFNAGGGKMDYPKRKDGEHIVVVDAPGGREEDPVTEDLWRQKIENVLSDDNGDPIVYLDEQKQELAVVYVGRDTKVSEKILEGNLLQIEINVQGGGKENRGRRRMMS